MNLNADSLQTLDEEYYLKKYLIALEAFQLLVLETTVFQQRNTVQEVEGRLRQMKLDGLRQGSVIKQDIQRLKTEISTARSGWPKFACTSLSGTAICSCRISL